MADPKPGETPSGRGGYSAVPDPPPRSGIDSTTLPERSVHDPHQPRQIRRRRSELQMPAMISPVDLAEDAEGRVEFIVVRADNDRDEQRPSLLPPPPPAVAGIMSEALRAGSGWIAVAVLAIALVVIFLVGTALVR